MSVVASAPERSSLVALSDRDVVRVRGADAVSYLQGQVSQDVEALAVGESAWSLILAPQGKVEAWFRLTRCDDGFFLDLDAGFAPTLVERLKRFLLRVDAQIEMLEGWQMLSVRHREPVPDNLGDADSAIVGQADSDSESRDLAIEKLESADAQVRATVDWPGFEGIDLVGAAVGVPSGVQAAEAADFEVARIRSGWPAMGRELTERTIPAEVAGLVEASVSFTKGCYTGQELVARIDSRGGNVPRPVRLLEIHTEQVLTPGTEIMVAEKAVGKITSAAFDRSAGVTVALGSVHRNVEPPAAAEVNGYRSTVLPTPSTAQS